MAEKYISHGNVFDGDGTTAGPAGSAGAVGAWNDLKAIMLAVPTYGTLAAGDTVHIRSQLSSVDITVDMATAATFTGHDYGTTSAPVVWLVDDGTVWAGDDGILTMNCLGNLYDLILGKYAIYDGNELRWVINSTGTTSHNQLWFQVKSSIIIGCKTTYTTPSINIGSVISTVSSWYDCYIDCRRLYSAAINISFQIAGGGWSRLINTEFHIDDLYKTNISKSVISLSGGYGCYGSIFGGKLTNSDAGKNIFYVFNSAKSTNNSRSGLFVKGFNYNGGNVEGYSNPVDGTDCAVMYADEMNGIPFDFLREDSNGRTSWEDNKNYPVLNASLPDNTTWSIKNYAGIDVSPVHLMEVMRTNKLFNITAATQKITVELLVKDTSSGNGSFDDMKKSDWFMVVSYRDNSTGDFVTEISTRDDTALETSIASWIPVVSGKIVYGENQYIAHKMVLTTTNLIKQNTLVNVVVYTTRKAGAVADYNFIDPDFTMETP